MSIINVPGVVNNDAMTMVGKRDGPKINRDDAMVIPLVTFNEASLPDRKVVKKKKNEQHFANHHGDSVWGPARWLSG